MEMTGYGYRCSAGETVDIVARNVYGDEKYAAELLCANPELATKVRYDGTELMRLPVIDMPEETDEVVTDTAPWRM